jgi:hypothetical protein
MPRVFIPADAGGLTLVSANQSLYYDAALTLPVPLPLTTNAAQVYYVPPGPLSVTLQDSNGAQVSLTAQVTGAGVFMSPHLDTVVATTGPSPSDFGLVEWSAPPDYLTGGTILAAGGTLYLVRVPVRQTRYVSNLLLNVTAAGSGLTSGQCFALLYAGAPGGGLLAQSASQHTAWQSTGQVASALAAPVQVPAGFVYVGFYANGTTLPTFARHGTTAAVNAGLAATASKYGSANTGLTTTPPTSLGAISALAVGYWAALS